MAVCRRCGCISNDLYKLKDTHEVICHYCFCEIEVKAEQNDHIVSLEKTFEFLEL